MNERVTLEAGYYKSKSETEGMVVAQSQFEEGLNVRIPGRAPFSEDDVEIISFNFDYEFDWATLEVAASSMQREGLSENEFPASVAAAFDSFIQFNILFRDGTDACDITGVLARFFFQFTPGFDKNPCAWTH